LNINPMADVNSATGAMLRCVRLLFPVSLGQPFIQRSDLTKRNWSSFNDDDDVSVARSG